MLLNDISCFFLRQIFNCCFCAISSRELSVCAIFFAFSTMLFAFVYFCLCPRNHLQTLEGPFVGRQGDSCLLFARRVHFHPIQQSPPIISTMPRAPQPPVEFTWCTISKICQLILQFTGGQIWITDINSMLRNAAQISLSWFVHCDHQTRTHSRLESKFDKK